MTIRSTDAGFQSDGDCGTWTRTSGLTETGADDSLQAPFEIDYNWNMHRQRYGRLSGMR